MTFRKRSNPEAAQGEIRTSDPLPSLIASIEQTVENFRQADLPRWKYRQIVRDQKEAAAAALAEATGVEEPAYSFGGLPPL